MWCTRLAALVRKARSLQCDRAGLIDRPTGHGAGRRGQVGAPTVPFNHRCRGREVAHAAPLPIAKGSSYAAGPVPLRDAGYEAGILRS